MRTIGGAAELRPQGGLFLAAGSIIVVELLLIAGIYQFGWSSGCPATAGLSYCNFLRSLVGRALAVGTLLFLLIRAFPRTLSALQAPVRMWPAATMNIIGVAFILLPMLAGGERSAIYAVSVWFWTAGAVLAGTGALFLAASPQRWLRLLRENSLSISVLLLTGFFLPDLVAVLDNLWFWDPLTDVTFNAVALALDLFVGEVHIDREFATIGVGDFIVEVGAACSGYQGLGLVTAVAGAYFYLYRDELRFPQALLLLPIGILASYVLNIFRIAMLIWIGDNINPKLALDGFHSYAGWLLFTLLAVALIGAGQTTPYFHFSDKATGLPTGPSLRDDPLAAMILPFVALMATGLVVNTFATVPGLWYPLRALTAGLVLFAFLKSLHRLEWRIDPLSVGVGAILGVLWFETTPPATAADSVLADALAGLSPAALAGWIAFRLAGTVLVIPLVEELFFRGYLFQRFDRPGPGRYLALAASSGAFAMLHDRWLAAFVVGVVYAVLTLRRGKLSDAIVAHASTNAIVAAWAVWSSDWAAI